MQYLIHARILLLIGAVCFLISCNSEEGLPGGESSDPSSLSGLSSSAEADGSYSGGAAGGGGNGNGPEPSAGQLTAGEWKDLDNWDFWQGLFDNEDLQATETAWAIQTREPYQLQVFDSFNRPVVGAKARLLDATGQVVWEAQSNHQGRVVLWPSLTAPTTTIQQIEVSYAAQTTYLYSVDAARQGVLDVNLPIARTLPENVDVYMVVDATGSMGDEITYIQAELTNVMQRITQDLSHLNVRLGASFYRDKDDDYLTRDFDLTTNHDRIIQKVQAQNAGGGGDWPEAVDAGLEAAILGQNWSNNAMAKLIFLILDAPPHEEDPQAVTAIQSLLAQAAAEGIRIIPISASGIDKKTEFLMRMMALSTNGTYTFITNHSGIGGDHIEPTIGDYEVEYLNDLMVRLVREQATQ